MKKQILSLLLTAATIPAVALPRPGTAAVFTHDRRVALTNDFSCVKAEGHVKVVLYESAAMAVSVCEEPVKTGSVVITEKEGVLIVSANRFYGRPAIVYVPVKSIREIIATRGAEVGSEGVLHSQITVRLCGDCKVSVTALEKINLVEDDGTEMEIEKNNFYLLTKN